MSKFVNEFRDFNKDDFMGYAGAEHLVNGEVPKICDVENPADYCISVIISGDEDNMTVISLETEGGAWILQLPGYNKSVRIIADSIVTDLKNLISKISEGFINEDAEDVCEMVAKEYEMIHI